MTDMDLRRELSTPVLVSLLLLAVLAAAALGVFSYIELPGYQPDTTEQVSADPSDYTTDPTNPGVGPAYEPVQDGTMTGGADIDRAGPQPDDIHDHRTTDPYGQPLDAPARAETEDTVQEGQMPDTELQQDARADEPARTAGEPAMIPEDTPADVPAEQELAEEELAEQELTEEEIMAELAADDELTGVPAEEERAEEELVEEDALGQEPDMLPGHQRDPLDDALHDSTRADIQAGQDERVMFADEQMQELFQRMTRQDLAVMASLRSYIDDAIRDVQNWADDRFATEDRVDDLESDVRQLEEDVYGGETGDTGMNGTGIGGTGDDITGEIGDGPDEAMVEDELAVEELDMKDGQTVIRHGDTTCYLTTQSDADHTVRQWSCVS